MYWTLVHGLPINILGGPHEFRKCSRAVKLKKTEKCTDNEKLKIRYCTSLSFLSLLVSGSDTMRPKHFFTLILPIIGKLLLLIEKNDSK